MDKKVKLLKALANETRIKILQCFLDIEQCACSIVPYVDKAQPTISQHLRILKEAGILESRREGVNIHYRIKSNEAKKIMQVLDIAKIKLHQKC